MTLKTILDSTADIIKMDRSTDWAGSDTQTERELVALANAAGTELMRRAEWPQLLKTLTVAAAQSSEAKPADFHRLIAGGAIIEGGAATAFMNGATSSDQWTLLKKSASTQPYFFINGTNIEFYPDTTANGALISYISKFWVSPSTGDDKASFTANDDTPLFSEDLMQKGIIWRWRRNQGQEYQDQLAEFEADFAAELKAAKGITV